jgi:hypothetical protein
MLVVTGRSVKRDNLLRAAANGSNLAGEWLWLRGKQKKWQ